ncbi:MAG: cytochrome oxidase putative small subunit CydP [Pseudomonadota bacterium]
MFPRRRGWPFWLTITLALVVKVIVLMAMHKAFFSAPQVKKMRMPTEKVERHLLGPASVPALPTKATP